MTRTLNGLTVKLFADGADKGGMLKLNADPLIQGMTTNPTLMRKAGVTDFEAFAHDILQAITAKPLSLEVFSDEFSEMKRQALKINGWGKNVYVKIPITNTRQESSLPLIRELAQEGVKLNVTALLTLAQVQGVAAALNPKHCGHGRGSGGHHGREQKNPGRVAAGGTALGQRPRGAEHFPGQRLRLPHCHRAA